MMMPVAGSRSLGSEASPNLSAKSTSSQDMPPTSLLGRIKIMEKEELQENMEIALNESNITSKCLDNLRNDLMVLSSSVDSQVYANKLLERKAKELEKVKGKTELRLFEMEEENVKKLQNVSVNDIKSN
ncbi:hypothetical protein Tco_0250590 [Tanacetum coccineum]